MMSHGRNKPGREKKKPKKEKLVVAKQTRETEVVQHISQHAPKPDEQPQT